MNQAKRDIQFQAPVELMIGEWLASKMDGLLAPKTKGRDSKKDITVYRPVHYELKCDYAADKTGNVFFEVFNPYRNEPSGLNATKANWWIHYIPSKAFCLMFQPKRMLRHLEENCSASFVSRVGDKNSDGYIIPISDVLSLSFVTTHELPII